MTRSPLAGFARSPRLMRITSKGQVTIPVEIREKAGFLPDTKVEFEMDPRACASGAPRLSGARGVAPPRWAACGAGRPSR